MGRTLVAIIIFAIISWTVHPLRADDEKPKIKTLATVDGVAITETQVRDDGAGDLETLELQKLKAKAVSERIEQEILEKYLAHLIAEKLLDMEAEKRGVAKQQLLDSEADSKVKEPTAEQIDSVYSDNANRIGKPKEEVADQIIEAIKSDQKKRLRASYIAKLEKEHKITRSLEPLRFDVNGADRPTQGPAAAPVTIVIFSDYQCPYCKEYSAIIKQVIAKYGDKVRIIFRQFPLRAIHPDAQKAAEASLCAARQSKFLEMNDRLFQNQSYLKVPELKNRAKDLGLDMDAFNACLDDNRTAMIVHEDIIAGFRAGSDGTPATFVNGRFLNVGAVPLNAVSQMIEDELARQETLKQAASGAKQ
jgi:protein-disulfide isomerase